MSTRRTTSENASCVGRISWAGDLFVTGAGAGVAEAGTGAAKAGTNVVGVMMAGKKVVPLEVASFRPMAGVNCVGAESLRRLRGREEPSMKGVLNFPGREAGLSANAERSSVIFWMSRPWSSPWCGTSLG